MKFFRDFYTQIGDWVLLLRARRYGPNAEDIDEDRWLARAE